MVEDRDELRRHYEAMREELLEAIEGLTDEQLTDPTLDGWSVKDHLVHLAMWDEIRASEAARISAGHESAWRMTEAEDASFNALGYRLRGGLSTKQARWELSATRERLLGAIAAATERGLDTSLYGEAPLRSLHEVEHAAWIRRWRAERGW